MAKVNLNTINKVKEFVGIACTMPVDIILRAGKFSVDGKSIMGVFSLNLTEPISLIVDSKDPAVTAQCMEAFKDFVVASNED